MLSLILSIAFQFVVTLRDNKLEVSRYPVLRGKITSSFGNRIDPLLKTRRFHSGVDISAAAGTPIRSISPGRVIFSGPYEGFGNLVAIQHGKDLTTHYAHCWGMKVKVGDLVSGSTILGFVGRSGRATGPHLHFEVRYRGIPINPEWIFATKGGLNGENKT